MFNTALYSFIRGGCYAVLVFAAFAFLIAPLASAMDPSGDGGSSGASALPEIVSAVVGGGLAGAALRTCGGSRTRPRSRSRSPSRAGGDAPSSASYSCVCGKSGLHNAASYSIHRRYCQHAIVDIPSSHGCVLPPVPVTLLFSTSSACHLHSHAGCWHDAVEAHTAQSIAECGRTSQGNASGAGCCAACCVRR